MEVVTPIGRRVLVRKDDNRKETKGGIVLPDKTEIPVITARILSVGAPVENDPDYPLEQYQKVLVNPANSIPVDFEDDQRFVVPVDDIVAVFNKSDSEE